ncbi:MAG: DUF983 domain-containing protein [Pseudomonadota bacterium]
MAVPPIPTGLAGRCPNCGQGSIFKGYLSLNETCPVCGLDLTFADAADGPAIFVMMIVGFVVVGLVLIIEVLYVPPIWLHLAYSVPLLLALSLGLLRPLKGVLIALQYHHDAAEGRLDRDP